MKNSLRQSSQPDTAGLAVIDEFRGIIEIDDFDHRSRTRAGNK